MSASVNRSIWRLETNRPGTVVFAAGASGEISRFDVLQAEEISRQPLCSGWINGLAYCKQTDSLAVATSRGELFALDASTQQARVSRSAPFWLNGIKKVGNDDQYIVTTAEGRILLWDVKPNGLTTFAVGHSDQVWDCAVSGDGQLAVTVGGNGELALWSIPRKEPLSWFSKGGYTLTSVVMLDQRGLIASVDMGGTITLWAMKNGHAISRFNAHDARIWSIAASPDQGRIVTAGADQRVVVWEVESMRILKEHRLDSLPTACAFHNTSGHVIVGDRVGRIKLLDDGSIPTKVGVNDADIAPELEANRIVAFINHTVDGPTGEYVARLLNTLDRSGIPYATVDVSYAPLRKQSLIRLSGCPLFPQLYVDGRFIGGSEVVFEMVEAGAFQRLFTRNAESYCQIWCTASPTHRMKIRRRGSAEAVDCPAPRSRP